VGYLRSALSVKKSNALGVLVKEK